MKPPGPGSTVTSGRASSSAKRANPTRHAKRPSASAAVSGTPMSSAWVASSLARCQACQRAG